MRSILKGFVRLIALMILIASISIPSTVSAALIQKAAPAGAKWGKSDGGGPFTKTCPAGYVATGVAVANAESFGYTTGFAFTCTQILEDGTLGTAATTITQVTNSPSNSPSVCASGYALVGVRVLLRVDPNNAAVYYVNDLGANCAKFTDRSVAQNMTMARNVKLGANNEYQDRDSSCSSGFVTGFDGRSGAGLDYAGVMCSTFTDENEGKPSPSYLIAKELPKISQNTTSFVCTGGEFVFMRYGAFEEKAAITERVFQLMRDGVSVGSVTVVGKTEGSFPKSAISGTYYCWEQARQENSLAISESNSRIEKIKEITRFYKQELRKASETRVRSDEAARQAYLGARAAAARKADEARDVIVTAADDFYAILRGIGLAYSNDLADSRSKYLADKAKNEDLLNAAREQALVNYYKALETAGISILVTKS